MGLPSAVIFSSDADLTVRLSGHLRNEHAIAAEGNAALPALSVPAANLPAEGTPAESGSSAGLNSETQQNSGWRNKTVFADLRELANWPEQIWRAFLNVAPTAHRIIGLVDCGIPVERAVECATACQAFLSIPRDQARLDHGRVLRAMHDAERNASSRRVQQPRELSGIKHNFVTHTPSLFPAMDELRIAARHDFTILLIGETGTGKTYLANLIHELSPRRERRIVHVACGALPRDLLDSELFGHKKGAFTGAEMDKVGKLELAEDGTCLLDEIDVLGLDQQVKLLRILESGEYERVGCNETRTLKARTIVASNLSLEKLIAEGRFRSDLYFRLKQVKFEIPPLRQRPLDILPLAVSFIVECSRQQNIAVAQISPEFIRVLLTYEWPGNIRELRNETRRAVLFCQDGVITPDLLTSAVAQEARSRIEQFGYTPTSNACLAREVALTEQETIESMLKTQNFNRAATARALGISRVTLYNKIRKYRIRLDRKPR